MLSLRKVFTASRVFFSESRRSWRSERGLTITETLITITILSFIIVLCLGLIIFIGRIYNRGIQDNKLQESSRRISTSVSEAIRTSGVEVIPLASAPDPLTPTSDWYGYCIGNVQYSFKLNVQLIADDGKTSDRQGGLTADQTEQAFIVSRACSKSGSADPDPNPPNFDPALGADQQFELLHDRMRILEFGIDRVGDNDNLYDIRLKMAVGGDINDPEYDLTVFEFIEHPCSAGTPAEEPLPLTKDDCENGEDEGIGTTLLDADQGTWTDPSSLTPVADPMNLTPDHIIHKCQSTAIECSVLETRTRVFRRIL